MTMLANSLRRFLRDEQGSMTVEFVIWIPWLLFYLVFTTAAYMAMDSRLEAMRASITLTDVTSRVEQPLDRAFLDNLGTMFGQLTPSAAPGSMVRISSLRLIGGNIEVVWTECYGGIEALTNSNLPVDVIPPMAELSTVLLVETFVPYSPISTTFGLQPVVWSNRKAVTPRFVPNILNDDAGVDQCGTTSVS